MVHFFHITLKTYLFNNYSEINMLNDLISQAINDYDIKYVMFLDDDPNNLNSFNQ